VIGIRRPRPDPWIGAVSPVYVQALNLRMLGLWLQDLESFEAISQNDDARRIFLRMAAMSHDGRLPVFLAELSHDDELDDETKDHLTELASDTAFLLAVEEYLRRTQRVH
jgi:hypothetical protein